MLVLTEGESPVYVNPQHVVLVRPRGENAVVMLNLGTPAPIQIIVSESAEDVAAAVTQLLEDGVLLEDADVAEEAEAEDGTPVG